jgi:nitric oxide synthase-interacting protein
MPASHSKRNTSLAFFTSYERSLLKTAWGSQKTRLNRDSFLPFGSCSLCLLPARDPVACPQGDLFCRECAISNLIAQRKEIARLEREWEKQKLEEDDAKVIEEEEEKDRAVKDFERIQMGFAGSKKRKTEDDGVRNAEEKDSKKKFKLGDEVLKASKEERERMREELDAEKKASAKSLPSFWVPSQTPDSSKQAASARPPKLQSFCPSSSESSPHTYGLKTLVTVNFSTPESSATKSSTHICPACSKMLSNSTKGVLAVPCGHVLCKACTDKFMSPSDGPDPHNPSAEHGVVRCYVCYKDLSDKKKSKESKKEKERIKPGLVELKSDGTGFASGGQAEVQKKGIAFQC